MLGKIEGRRRRGRQEEKGKAGGEGEGRRRRGRQEEKRTTEVEMAGWHH